MKSQGDLSEWAPVILICVTIATWSARPTRAQVRATTIPQGTTSTLKSAGSGDWPLNSLDLHNSRYSALDEINTANVSKLVVKWSLETAADNVLEQVTPLVVDGVMYFNAGSKAFAVNAATGAPIWNYEVTPAFPGIGRGPAYGDGRLYAYGRAVLYAIDVKKGQLVQSFGDKGQLRIADAAVRFKYPAKKSTGYFMVSPPTYFNGTLYVGLAQSEGHIPGGLVAAIDGTTGTVKWVFNTVPQGPDDDGWDIAKSSWRGGARAGGGLWTQPAIDSQLGLLYINVGNPSPDYEGTARHGSNLFTNSIVALHLATGKLAWYYQAVHHDLWDWDLASGPVLFDVTVGGKILKGVGSGGKNCLLYLWNRETGEPISPMVETAVPTKTDVPGEEVSPTQPFPYTAKGVPMTPFCATFPIISDPERAKRARPMYFPYSTTELVIVSHGGSSFGSPAFSPRTGLLYVTGKNAAISMAVKVVGDTLRPADVGQGSVGVVAHRDPDTGLIPTETVTAYNPATGELVWQEEHATRTNIGSAGSLVTAGDLVFQGSDTGQFLGLDARSGKELFTYTAMRSVRASPVTYQVNGRQFVSTVARNMILTFGLP